MEKIQTRMFKKGDVWEMKPPYSITDTYEPFLVLKGYDSKVIALPIVDEDDIMTNLHECVTYADPLTERTMCVLCDMPMTIMDHSINFGGFIQVMPDDFMSIVESAFAEEMGFDRFSLTFLHDPVLDMVRNQLKNNVNNITTVTALTECIDILANLKNDLVNITTMKHIDNPDEDDVTIIEDVDIITEIVKEELENSENLEIIKQ